MLMEPLRQVPDGLLAGPPLVGNVRDQVRRDVPLAVLLDVHDGFHDGNGWKAMYMRDAGEDCATVSAGA